jgi:hypothetical protein
MCVIRHREYGPTGHIHASVITIHPVFNPRTQHDGWSHNEPICDTVRCGETAAFSIRDGGSCSATVPYSMKDASGAYTFSCGAANATNSPCKSCAGNTNFDGCRWSWTAPTSVPNAFAIVTPTTNKCRCTPYQPYPISDWLCSASSCPAATGRHRRQLLGTCPPAYTGTPGCWLQDNWSKIMQLQGLGPSVDALVLGAGDRTVSLNLEALKCACSAWNLAGKTLAVKAAP